MCGLRNGTVEIWNVLTLEREMSLTEQEGSVQVRRKSWLVLTAAKPKGHKRARVVS